MLGAALFLADSGMMAIRVEHSKKKKSADESDQQRFLGDGQRAACDGKGVQDPVANAEGFGKD